MESDLISSYSAFEEKRTEWSVGSIFFNQCSCNIKDIQIDFLNKNRCPPRAPQFLFGALKAFLKLLPLYHSFLKRTRTPSNAIKHPQRSLRMHPFFFSFLSLKKFLWCIHTVDSTSRVHIWIARHQKNRIDVTYKRNVSLSHIKNFALARKMSTKQQTKKKDMA